MRLFYIYAIYFTCYMIVSAMIFFYVRYGRHDRWCGGGMGGGRSVKTVYMMRRGNKGK